MPTDYDTARPGDDGLAKQGVEELMVRRAETVSGLSGLDEADSEPLELPSADLSGEELIVQVVPRQDDEFTCSKCFLVLHRSRLGRRMRSKTLCVDCG